jgi:hypothetical protein
VVLLELLALKVPPVLVAVQEVMAVILHLEHS